MKTEENKDNCKCTILSICKQEMQQYFQHTLYSIKQPINIIIYIVFSIYIVFTILNKQFRWYGYINLFTLLALMYYARKEHINKTKDILLLLYMQFYYYIYILPIVYYSFKNYILTLLQMACALLLLFTMYNYITWSLKPNFIMLSMQIIMIALSFINLIAILKKILVIYPAEQLRYCIYIITGGPALNVDCSIRYATWYDYLGLFYRYIIQYIINIKNGIYCYDLTYFQEGDSKRYHLKGYTRVKIAEHLNRQNTQLVQELQNVLLYMDLPVFTKEDKGVYSHITPEEVNNIRQQMLQYPDIQFILKKYKLQSILDKYNKNES